jgi:hypothetical protein
MQLALIAGQNPSALAPLTNEWIATFVAVSKGSSSGVSSQISSFNRCNVRLGIGVVRADVPLPQRQPLANYEPH